MGGNKTVFVAMSGGVDSSVAAALLKKAGFSVVGVFMKPWSPNGEIPKSKFQMTNKIQIPNSRIQNLDCVWKQDREDALRVAAKLDIPLLTWDFSKEYEKRVAGYMIDGYRRGITPNPDVMCNKFIKFGLFLDKALEAGTDYIATGHYVRLRAENPKSKFQMTNKIQIPNDKTNTKYRLLKAKDQNKDQSYFLYTLTQKQLKYCLFPLGDYVKDKVRKMARKFGLPNWDKKDSQGVCFVGPLKVKEFLKRRIKPQEGLVIRKNDGRILGEHDGVWYYTIGQRHGMGLSAGKPYYVVGKDVRKNILYVDSLENSKSQFSIFNEIQNSKFQIKDLNWLNDNKNLPLRCKVKMRYRQKDLDCAIIKNGGAVAEVKIKAENIPIAPGQAAVFYKGSEVLGGGTIV